jgi:NTP pyrophosphatase (non-canonical NTP hydrolase)
MEYVIDGHGKKIPKSYFGNLKEKLDTCRGYVGMYNQMAAEQVEIDLDDGVKANYPKFGDALKKITGLSG